MTVKELSQMLNRREYCEEITNDEEQMARECGLVVVFGYSDDNAEFRGAIDDEVGCYEGGTIRLTKEGVIQEPDCGEEDCKYFKECVKNAKTIEAVWCDDASGAAWSYKTDIPHEIFNVYEDGELFCIGIVFSVLMSMRTASCSASGSCSAWRICDGRSHNHLRDRLHCEVSHIP